MPDPRKAPRLRSPFVSNKRLDLFNPKKGKTKWVVVLAGPKGGGRIILKANGPSEALDKATFQVFGRRKGFSGTPKGTEGKVTRLNQKKGITNQFFFDFE